MSLPETDAIDAYYGEGHTIRGLSMSVEGDEICALLGRNDTGKTITLRCIASVTPPEARKGIIRFKDDDITGVPAEDVSVWGISPVPEEWRIFPNLSVAKNLRLAETVNNKSNTSGRSLSFGHKGMSTGETYDQFSRLDER